MIHKIKDEIKNGYRLTEPQFKNIITKESQNYYVSYIVSEGKGLSDAEFGWLTLELEKKYKKIRGDSFQRFFIENNKDITEYQFIQLSEVDKNIFIKTLAKKNIDLPHDILNMDNRRYYNLWWQSKNSEKRNREQRDRLRVKRSDPEFCRKDNQRKKLYRSGDKAKERANEYRRIYYQKNKEKFKKYERNKNIKPKKMFSQLFQYILEKLKLTK